MTRLTSYVPSLRSCATPLRSLVVFNTWAVTVRSSPCSNLSNLCSASSISLLPISFLRNVPNRSEGSSATDVGDKRTRSLLLHLLCCNSEYRQHLCHNLSHHIRHRCSWRDFCIGLETYKEVFDFVEEFDERIAARSRVPSRLSERVL